MSSRNTTAAKKPAAKIAGKVQGSPALNKQPNARPAAKLAEARPAAVIGSPPFGVKSMLAGAQGDYFLRGTTWTAHRPDADTFDDAAKAQAAIDRVAKLNPKGAKHASIVGQAMPLPTDSTPADKGIAAAKADDAERRSLRAAGKPIPATLTGEKAKGAGKGKAEAAPKPARHPGGKRAAILAAQAGKLPEPPDFSAVTHKPYRARLAFLVDLATKGDLKRLRAVEMIPPRSTSPKALHRYRDLAMTALEAQAKAGRRIAKKRAS
jgi:hypothetical protein